MSKYPRKKKLIKTGLQLKLIATFLFLASLSSIFQVILLNNSILKLSQRMRTDGQLLLNEAGPVLTSNVLLTIGVLLPVMLIVGVLVTHRIAGPVYRFEQHLGAIARGENPGVCRIRKGDELQSLCKTINAAVDQLNSKADQDQTDQQAEAAQAPESTGASRAA